MREKEEKEWLVFEGRTCRDAVLSIELFIKGVNTAEVGQRIGLILFHLTSFYQFEHEATEIFSRINSPLLKDCLRHQSKLLESQQTNPFQ